MRDPSHLRSTLVCILVMLCFLLAPCQARAFLDDDVWVTSGIVAGITLGVCVAIVLLAGVLTDLKGETDSAGPDFEHSMEAALGRLPPGFICRPSLALAGQPGGLCAPAGCLPAAAPEGQVYPPLHERLVACNRFDDVWPLGAGSRLQVPWLARSPEPPAPLSVLTGESSLNHEEGEARSGLPF